MRRYAFIPSHLQIKDRPELDKFPLNIMIVSYTGRDFESFIMGTVVYEPLLSSYSVNGGVELLIYNNPYDVRFYFRIYFDTKDGSYKADKYRFEEKLFVAFGNNWNQFFVHVGWFSLSQGEKCILKVEKYTIPIKPGLN